MTGIAILCLTVFPAYLQTLLQIYICGLFAYMVLEDLMCQTVDMRIWFALFLCMQIHRFSLRFYIDFVMGIIIYFFIFSCSWKRDHAAISSGREEEQEALGLLPSLALAIMLWIGMQPLSLTQKFQEGYELLLLGLTQEPLWLTVILPPILYSVYKQSKLWQANKRQEPIQYAMGGGDIWVCSAWTAFYGLPVFSSIFFIALCIHLLNYRMIAANENKGG